MYLDTLVINITKLLIFKLIAIFRKNLVTLQNVYIICNQSLLRLQTLAI